MRGAPCPCYKPPPRVRGNAAAVSEVTPQPGAVSVWFPPQINKAEKLDRPESCDNVKVVVRCRPLNEREKATGYKMAVSVDEMRGTITVHKTDSSNEPPKTFTFDTVFGPESKQLDVYNLTARPIIDSVLEGYNGKCLVSSLCTPFCAACTFSHAVGPTGSLPGEGCSCLFVS